jgi:hypothetical protein
MVAPLSEVPTRAKIVVTMDGGRPDSNRIGTALRLMAEDLASERRRVRALQREVNALRAQLAALQGPSVPEASAAPAPRSLTSGRPPS